MRKYILDEKHSLVECPDLIEWAQWMETGDRIVGKEVIRLGQKGIVQVSTVFLGMDHGFVPFSRVPLLFETAIFGGRDICHLKFLEVFHRQTTWQEAEDDHKWLVKKIQESGYPYEGD